MFVSFKQSLLRGVRISPMEGIARTHAAHREERQLHNFAAQLGHALEPVHLSFLAQLVTLRYGNSPPTEPHLPLPHLYMAPHRGFPDGIIWMLVPQPYSNPMGRMPLLARCFYIQGKHLIDVFLGRTKPGRFPNCRFSIVRNRVPDRLPHHPPVHTMLLG